MSVTIETLLVLTVGGSPEPLVTAFETVAPDHVLFICTGGSSDRASEPSVDGKAVGFDKKPTDNLVTRMGLDRESYTKCVLAQERFDDLSYCHEVYIEAIRPLKAQSRRVTADYTGGTKTMCAAMVLAALDLDIELNLTSGVRTDTRAVSQGQVTQEVSLANLNVARALVPGGEFCTLIDRYLFDHAAVLIRRLLRPRDLSPANRSRLWRLQNWVETLDAWDRFDHKGGLEKCTSDKATKFTREHLFLPLSRLTEVRSALSSETETPSDLKKNSGFELIDDLLQNAKRRSLSGRYDDAVGRLYRALEMMAQMQLLWKYDIKSGDVKPDQIPDDKRSKYPITFDACKIKLGLMQAYELLADLNDEAVGLVFAKDKLKYLDALQTRNSSLFAHGYNSISKQDYVAVYKVMGGFLDARLAVLMNSRQRIPDFPSALDLVNYSKEEVS